MGNLQRPREEIAPLRIPSVGGWLIAARVWGWLWAFHTKKPLGAIGLTSMIVIVLAAVFAPLVTFSGPLDQNFVDRLQAPGLAHWFGTDQFGRDVYSRIVYGTRVSLTISFLAIALGGTIGLFVGIISGWMGSYVDTSIMRLVDLLLAFPGILLAMSLMAVLGSGIDKVIIALTVISVPQTIRIIRGQVLSVKQEVFIDAARVIGAGDVRIMLKHILPNVMATYLILASLMVGNFIVMEATLSYLGLGVPPPHPSWGNMLSKAQAYAMTAPWLVVFPGLAITGLVVSFNVFGDALRDVWDPRLRGL